MNADPGDLPNYKALRSLVAMLETGSVRKAEAQTGSKRVHEDLIAIEGMLGLAYPLLAEQDAGGGLTDDGKRLAGLARGVLIAYGRLDALADEMRRETENVIRVGALSHNYMYLLNEAITEFERDQGGDARVECTIHDNDGTGIAVREDYKAGRVDAGVWTLASGETPRTARTQIASVKPKGPAGTVMLYPMLLVSVWPQEPSFTGPLEVGEFLQIIRRQKVREIFTMMPNYKSRVLFDQAMKRVRDNGQGIEFRPVPGIAIAVDLALRRNAVAVLFDTTIKARVASKPPTRLLFDGGRPLEQRVWLHYRRRRGLRADLMDRFADTVIETAKRKQAAPPGEPAG
jgi:DNA-binding transcriptional LysR family regulator